MDNWSIKNKNGVVKYTVKAVEYHDTWMGEEFLTVTIKSPVPLDLAIGDYIEYRGLTYTIYNVPSALKTARRNTYGDGFSYDDVKFSALSTELSEMRFFDIVLQDNNLHYTSLPRFSFYCEDVDDLLDRLQANTNRSSSSQWYFISPSYARTIARYEEGTTARTEAIALWKQYFGDDTSRDPAYSITDVNIDVDDKTVWDGLSFIKESFGLNFINRDRACIIGGEGVAAEHIFKYGKGEGLSEISRTTDSDQLVVTKLYAYGSDTNLPLRYYASEESGLPNNMAVNVLMLPGFPTYSLSQLCRCTYDSETDKTTFEVRKDTDSEYNEFMVIDGNHVVDFSSDALAPYLISANYSALGVKEGIANFTEDNDDNGLKAIYPSIEGMTVGDIEGSSSTERIDEILSCDVITDNGVFDEGATVASFHLVLKNLGFDLKAAYDKTGSMNLSMKDGYCGGREFTVKNVEPYNDGTWRLTVERSEDGNLDLFFPYSSAAASGGTPSANEPYQIRTGDHFILTGIEIDDTSYIWAASMKMLRKSILYLIANDYTRYSYTPKVDEIYMARQHDFAVANNTTSLHDTLKSGMLFIFEDTDFNISGNIFIDSLVIKENPSEKPIPTYEVVLREDKQVGTLNRMQNQIDSISSYISGNGGMSIETVRSLIRTVGGSLFLSKTVADAAQGVIAFMKGLVFGNGDTGISENGDATLNSVRTPSYSGTDIVSDKGFRVWEDNEGKSHMMVDYFSARIKAFFASLEIRKIEHSAGNRIESPAGNTLALVKKFDASGQEVKDLWYARRYTFAGVSFGMPKLVYQVANYFGVWKEDPSATVAFYRCYWTAEDKEDKKAVENNWRVGDQAFCQTFNLRVPQGSGYTSNKRYWRIVEATGYETIEGTEYAYIDLSNTLWLELTVDGVTKTCKGYETSGGQNFNDAPEAGDDVACLGNQITPEERGGALQYITYDPNASDPQSSGVPCVKMYSGIGSDVEYPFDLDRYVIQVQSPKGVYVRADKFEILSASGTGSSTLTCERGAWDSTQTYGHNDIVQHHGSTWLCVVAVGTTTQVEPSESVPTIWQVYARRGASTPQLEVDSANAVVSANYEGKITNISAATGLPTTIEVYVDGEQIPVANWNLVNSRIRWYNNWLNLTGQMYTIAFGITVDAVTPSTNSVGVTWEYVPERQLTIEGERTFHPVINPTDIVVHVEFTHNGETKYADATVPMIVQKAAANVQAQYSADNSSWHPTLQANDLYVRYSYDGGTTWTQGTRFVGKSIEFEKGIRHFASYSDLEDYLVSIETHMTDKDMGYYIADTDDGGVPEATLWYFYTESSDPRDIEQVSITNEVNYLTSYDGHLWNADNTSEYWTDMGVIQGADGVDGISVTLNPASVIFEQNEDNIDTFTPSPSSFTATVNVWKGTTLLTPSSYKVAIQSSTNCTATTASNQIVSLTLSKNNQNVYYPSGSVVLGVWLDPTSTSQTPDTTLTFNWAANLLGTWKMSVREDTMEAVSEQECAIYDENGDIIHVPFSSVFGQSAQNIFASVQGLKGRTGIDIEDGTITLDAERTVVTNDFEVKKVKTIPTESGIQIQIAEGLFQVFGLAGVANWRFGVNAQGQAILSYYNDAGQELYNLGPDGLSTIDNMPERFTAVNNRYIPSSLIGKGGDTTHNIGSNDKILNLLKSSVWEDMFKVRSIGNDLYLYGARKTVTSGGTIYYGRDTLPAEVTYSATATIASIADGKYFTSREDLQNATTGAAVNTVKISSAVGLLVTSLQRIDFEGMTDSAVENTLYGLKIQHYNPYKSAIYDQLAVTDPGWFCNTFPTLSDIRANTIQIYTAILQDMAGNMFTVLQRKVYT